jgi:hypothetical protein
VFELTENTFKPLLSSTWTREMTFNFKFNSVELSIIVHTILTKILPAEGLVSGELAKDYKGRDKANIMLNWSVTNDLPSDDELIFLKAENIHNSEEKLQFNAYTIFDHFQKGGHIAHKVSTKMLGFHTNLINPKLLGFIAPIKITSFRFGLEKFKSRLAPLSLGYVPTVVERMIVDCLDG